VSDHAVSIIDKLLPSLGDPLAHHTGGYEVSWYLVAACTGRSAGFSPLRMRST
jgi:hypothetical protein